MFLYGIVGEYGFSTLSTELSTEKGPETPALPGFWQAIVDNFCRISSYPQGFAQDFRVCPHIFQSFIHEKCENHVLKILRKRNKYFFLKYENTNQIPHPLIQGEERARATRYIYGSPVLLGTVNHGDDKEAPDMV